MVGRKGWIEFWIPDEELKKLIDNKDHYFVFGWDSTPKELALVLYIDGDRVKTAIGPGRNTRLSPELKNDAYVKATYKSQLDELLTFGKEESLKRKDAEN